MGDSDYTIVLKLLAGGDKTAFNQLVDNYHQRLCVYACSLVRDHVVAEDLVQNVFLKIWHRRSELTRVNSLKNFLYRSVYNEYVDHYRKTRSLSELEKRYFEQLDQVVRDSEDEAENERLFQEIKLAIAELPPKCRQVFEMSKFAGMKNADIARSLDISVKAVEFQITKAYTRIRSSVGGEAKILVYFFNSFWTKRSLG